MKWFLKLIFRGQYHHIQHMREEITWLRGQVEYERRRANAAVDRLLGREKGVQPVTPPTPAQEEQMVREQRELADLFKNPELSMMGMTDGVDH